MSTDVAALVREAAGGDEAAWDALVDRFSGLVWSVTRGYGLSTPDAADVSQTTWLRLAEHLGRIRDPDRIGVWLATTARNETFRTLRRARRQVPVGRCFELLTDELVAGADGGIMQAERDKALWRAFDSLPASCKALLRTLLVDPPPSYAEVSAALGMPIGSIGPSRRRCLERLGRRAGVAPPDGTHLVTGAPSSGTTPATGPRGWRPSSPPSSPAVIPSLPVCGPRLAARSPSVRSTTTSPSWSTTRFSTSNDSPACGVVRPASSPSPDATSPSRST